MNGVAAGILTLCLLGLLVVIVEWLGTRPWRWVQALDMWLNGMLAGDLRTAKWLRRRAWWRRHSLEVAAYLIVAGAFFVVGQATATPSTAAAPPTVEYQADVSTFVDRSQLRTLDVGDADWDRWVNVLISVGLLPRPDHRVVDQVAWDVWEAQAASLGDAWCATLAAGTLEQVAATIAVTSDDPMVDARLAGAASLLLCRGDQP